MNKRMLGALGESELGQLEALFAPANIAGDRYAPELMRLLDHSAM